MRQNQKHTGVMFGDHGLTTARSQHTTIMILLLSAVLSLPSTVASQDATSVADTAEATVLWHEAPALYPIRIVVPEGFDSTKFYPAIVALHGFGSSSRAFEHVAQPFTRAGYVVVVPEAPYPVPSTDTARHSSWMLTTLTTPPLTEDGALEFRSALLTTVDFVPSAVDAAEEHYHLDPVYLLGFSLGGVEAIIAGFYNRERFDGIIAAGVRGFERGWFTAQGDSLETGNHLPVFLIQGRSDPLVPFSEAERARDLLRAAGYDVTLSGFPGGHKLPEQQLERVVKWLEDLKKP